MARIRGLRKLNKVVSAQLQPFGITKAECSTSYGYYRNTHRVEYKLTEDTLEDMWFTQFVEEKFGYKVTLPFIFSLLHEVGHHMTDKEIDDMTDLYCEDEKTLIDKEMENAKNLKKCRELEWRYFNLPDEIKATTWAVEYMKTHTAEIEEMWEKILVALEKFYKKNGVL